MIQPSYFRNEVTVAATSQSNNYICLDAESRRQDKTDGKTSRELQHGNFHARHYTSDREIVNLLRLLQAQQPSGLTGYYSSHVASQIG